MNSKTMKFQPLVLADVVDAGDVRMVEAGGAWASLRKRRIVSSSVWSRESTLTATVAAEPRVDRAKHGAHAAAADELDSS